MIIRSHARTSQNRCTGCLSSYHLPENTDRERLLGRLGTVLQETSTSCFGRALIPNHFHLLLKTGNVPVAQVMRRLLTGRVVAFNRRHRRCGRLFQNRYKSILCQEDSYLLELVRYMHLKGEGPGSSLIGREPGVFWLAGRIEIRA